MNLDTSTVSTFDSAAPSPPHDLKLHCRPFPVILDPSLKENVICVVRQGTGKTHISIALSMAGIDAGFRVRLINAVTLLQELLAAQQEVQLSKYLESWGRIDLVTIDELGRLQLGPGTDPNVSVHS